MGFCIMIDNEELNGRLGACPLCYSPVRAAEIELHEEYMHYSESRIKVECQGCFVTFDIEARTWKNERNYRTAWPAIEIWNILSSRGRPAENFGG